jgi:predicted thioesterase
MKVLEPHLGPEHGSVGTRVDVRHLAPTPNGMRVRATAEVVEVDRRRVVFKVSITDEVEPIGEATHERFIVDLNRFEERLRAKHESQV